MRIRQTDFPDPTQLSQHINPAKRVSHPSYLLLARTPKDNLQSKPGQQASNLSLSIKKHGIFPGTTNRAADHPPHLLADDLDMAIHHR